MQRHEDLHAMLGLTEQELKKIILRRDRRYDGRFYFGVKTTGIYCRPVCPAKPKPENIVLFRSASEAERAGYRPCLRCRPDVAPGSKLLDGTGNTVARALRLMESEHIDGFNVDVLAGKLGVSSRHLRRLFNEHLGASPIEIIQIQRLHFAKKAIEESNLPISDVAFIAGFQSIRRFNEAFKTSYHKSPREFRTTRKIDKDPLTLKIPVHLPYDGQTVLAYLKRHETYGVERVTGNTYQRFVPLLDKSYGSFIVSWSTTQTYLTVQFENIPLTQLRAVIARIRILFDTDHNPLHLPKTSKISGRGIRVPANFDPFETAISIILSQLVSTENAKNRLKKLVERFGKKLSEGVYAFPAPGDLADARLKELGLTKVMSESIRSLAVAVCNDEINFETPVDFTKASERLVAIKGIGPWTAAMIGMRCFRNPDAFPASDLIVHRAVEQGMIASGDWLSFRSYLTHCLWRDFSGTLSKKKGAKL